MAANRVNLLGVSIDPLTAASLNERAEKILENGSRSIAAYVHVHGINLARADQVLASFYRRAEIVYCDGEGVRLGARILGYRIPERIALTDWIWDLFRICERRGAKVYLLGSRTEVVEEALRKVKEKFPRLNLVGCHDGYFEKEGPGSEQVIKEINRLHPDVMLVGFGMPIQERWLMRNRDQLDVKFILTAGSCFDYVSGRKRRCPQWMARHGLEWLYRLIQEPRRLFKRYFVGNPVFIARVLHAAVRSRK